MALLKIVIIGVLVMAGAISPATLLGDDPASHASGREQPSAPQEFAVAALVNEQPVYRYEVERALVRALGERQVTARARDALRQKALEQLIDQRLVVQFAQQRQLVSQAEFQRAWNRLAEEWAAQELDLAQYLRRSQRTEAELRHSLWYGLAWESLLRHYLTDANLAKHFERNRRDFDGTRLRLAQIYFRLPSEASPQDIESTQGNAAEILANLKQQQLTFADAARQYSQAPSASEGGEIGWIERHQPMPEAFSRAAFALEVNQISQPVTSTLGIHLIQLLEVKPGTRDWRDCRAELAQAVRQYLFRWSADQQRAAAKIEKLNEHP